MERRSASSSGVGFAAGLVEELAAGADQLVDRLDHVHRDADGARLVGDRAGDRLADPPGRVGREFVAAAIFELIDRLHQADIAFLDEVEELQAAVGVFLGDRDDEAEVGLDHFLLGDARLALGLLDLVDDAAELAERSAGRLGDVGDLGADALDGVALGRGEGGPFLVDAGRRRSSQLSSSSWPM